MSINRLMLRIVMMFIILGSISTFFLYQFFQSIKYKEDVLNTNIEVLKLEKNISYSITKFQLLTNEYIESGEEKYYDQYQNMLLSGIFHDSMNTIFDMKLLENQKEIFSVIDELAETKFNTEASALNATRTGNHTEAKKLILDTKFVKTNEDLQAKIRELDALLQEKNELEISIANKKYVGSFLTAAAFVTILMILTIIALSMINKKIKPLQKLKEMAGLVGQGKLSFEYIKIKQKSKDEILILADSFQGMIEELKSLISTTQTTSHNLSDTATSLLINSDQTNQAAISVASTIEHLSEGSQTQQRKIVESTLALEEVTIGLNHITKTIIEVLNSSEQADKQAQIGQHANIEVEHQMTIIEETLTKANDSFALLLEKTKQIDDIIASMSEFAEQTNLLSLNASIEAARAGEHGKGFNVVAQEIRKLADQSNHSAKTIKSIIQGIQHEAAGTSRDLTEVNAQVQDGVAAIKNTSNILIDITKSSKKVAAQVEDITAATEQISSSAVQVEEIFKIINNIAEENAVEAEHITALAQELASFTVQISDSAKVLHHLSQDLTTQINKFEI